MSPHRRPLHEVSPCLDQSRKKTRNCPDLPRCEGDGLIAAKQRHERFMIGLAEQNAHHPEFRDTSPPGSSSLARGPRKGVSVRKRRSPPEWIGGKDRLRGTFYQKSIIDQASGHTARLFDLQGRAEGGQDRLGQRCGDIADTGCAKQGGLTQEISARGREGPYP